MTKLVLLKSGKPDDLIENEEPVLCLQRGTPQFVTEHNVTESDLLLGDCEKHFVTCGMFMCSTLESSVFMGKNCSDN